MHYYDPEDRKPARWASAAAAAYVLLLLLAFLIVTFDFTREELPGEGLLVVFGTSDAAAGERDLQAAAATASAQTTVAETPSGAGFITTDRSEVTVREQPPVPDKPRQTPSGPEPSLPSDAQAAQPTVNRRALFPGRTAASAPSSAGTTADQGRVGDPSGSPDGSQEGTGQSDQGPSYDLSGRSVQGELPKPRYTADETGKVIVDVTVDATGRVTSAAYRSQGSTTNNSELVAAAVEAARKARFSESETIVQGGTITYIFRMN